MSFQKISLSSNLSLNWPSSFSNSLSLCDKNEVTPSANGFSIFLPDATQNSEGSGGQFNNVSSFSFTLKAFGQTQTLATIAPGQVVEVYTYNNSSNVSAWRVVASPVGNSNISYISLLGDGSIVVSGGNVTSPGGVVALSLSASLSNIASEISSPGFPVVTGVGPLNWTTRHLVAGDNISISNANGVLSDPVISLSSSISAVSSIDVGDITISGSIIDANLADSDLSISSNGTGKVYINGLSVDTKANLSGINNISIAGKFVSPYTISAWANFTDTLITGGNVVSIKSTAGASTVTGNGGTYVVNFLNPMPNINYAVFITPSSNDSSTPLVTHGYPILKTLNSVTIVVVDEGGEKVASVPLGISVMVIST